jgi:hypothetical protein
LIVVDKYRPSCGTEGADFTASWCGRCKGDIDDDCPINASTFVYDVDHPDYPAEWQYERGEPVCTAFDAIDPLDVPQMRAAAIKDMFPGPRRPTQGEQIRMMVMGKGGNA